MDDAVWVFSTLPAFTLLWKVLYHAAIDVAGNEMRNSCNVILSQVAEAA